MCFVKNPKIHADNMQHCPTLDTEAWPHKITYRQTTSLHLEIAHTSTLSYTSVDYVSSPIYFPYLYFKLQFVETSGI